MRIAIFSDVHGNLPALEAFVQATRESTDMYVCLGDVVNYGPWNDECLELVLGLPGIVFLEGNHERLFLGSETVSNLLPLVQQFYHHSIQQFTRRRLISNLPLEYQLEEFVCRHTIADKRIYHNTEITVDRNYIIGHTHHAFDIERGGYRIINCGSVGQNRGRLDYISYALMDTDIRCVTLKERKYPVDRLLAEMTRRGYPEACLDYYDKKISGT